MSRAAWERHQHTSEHLIHLLVSVILFLRWLGYPTLPTLVISSEAFPIDSRYIHSTYDQLIQILPQNDLAPGGHVPDYPRIGRFKSSRETPPLGQLS